MSPALVVLLPLLGAPLPWVLWRLARVDPALTAGALAAAALAMLLAQAGPVFDGATLVHAWGWMPSIGLSASYRLDGYSLLFALLVLGIGLLVIVYARYYLAPEDSKPRFFGLLLLFMGAMLGLVLAENLLLLVVYWELTSLSSFLLIGFWRGEINARRGARLALLVTGAGGLALLAGVLLLGHVTGSFELSVVLASGELIKSHPLYAPILALVLLGAFTKSAQFPFHFWLPHAMAAPTPVSAYLHSATMVKAGVFLIGRLFPALAGTETWFYVVSGVGLTTQLFASYVALFRHDLKGLLAYSTVSHLGLITLLFGLGTPLGETAAVFHIINHAVFKASLFMAAGIVDHETGTRDMRRLSGLARYMPWTAALATVAAAAMAGVPLLNGFLSKEMFFAETFQVRWLGDWYWLLPVAATLASTFTVAYSMRFVHDVFFGGEPRGLPKTPHEPPLGMKIPVVVLVALCLAVGLAPGVTVEGLLRLAAGAVLQGPLPEFSVKLWHGLNLPLAMSVLALVAGSAIYFSRRYLFDLHGYRASTTDGRVLSERFVGALVRGSRVLIARVANGSLQRYSLLLVLAALVLGAWGARGLAVSGPLARSPADPVSLLLVVALAAAALAATVFHAQRALAIVLVGVVGLVVSLAFARLSAPDLALTQLLVEIATVILLMLAMYFLPRGTPQDSSRTAPAARRRGRLRGGARRRRARLRDADPAVRLDRLVLPRERQARGRRLQRGQRDPGRLPRLRHARRDHRARHRGGRRLCVAAGAAADRSGHRRVRTSVVARGSLAAADDGREAAAAAGAAGVRVPFPARPQRPRRGFHRRAGDGHCADPAVHRQRQQLGPNTNAVEPDRIDRSGHADRSRDRPRQLVVRQALPDLDLRLPELAGGRHLRSWPARSASISASTLPWSARCW